MHECWPKSTRLYHTHRYHISVSTRVVIAIIPLNSSRDWVTKGIGTDKITMKLDSWRTTSGHAIPHYVDTLWHCTCTSNRQVRHGHVFCTTWHWLARDAPKCQWPLSVSGWWLVWSCGVVKGTPTMAQLNDSAPSHYLNQYRVIVNWTLRNKLQWNVNHNTKLFVHNNASEIIACEMAAISSRPQCFNRKWVGVNLLGKLAVRNVTDLAIWNVFVNLKLSR